MRAAVILACVAAIAGMMSDRVAAEPAAPEVTRIAVFEFELEDVTPAGELGQSTSSDASLQKTTAAAREQLEASGRYRLVSLDGVKAEPENGGALYDCGGCETAIAREVGAQQSMIGFVRRVTQTDYYIVVVIRDVGTGEVVTAQAANFAGGESGWASGVRKLIRRQVLAQ